ncbi:MULTISPECIES: DUF308 domain-containing protein [Methanoculleus]|uniref:Uncharacterized protein n=2 Tax=Methanoculleus TaxID=45989 RepID=A3CWC4_METMJ|nr:MULTISPECIES: DUF308 domain-containing protein [Methanoculleus]ABN57674.1 conserved hypothetical protein [Methanoculleus marisnigri JR1]MCC7556809.1 DUF308 domain-containing protein [Methanoculleus marisnigri]UYU19068.1 DUF308 domain-containing protein [Methanoculleus submarinus]
MSTLESYLDALHQGVYQVVVPKAVVTEPLEPDWKRSAINVPSPGTLASYRRGQYHAHETVSEYRVHMDRYDPEKNPLMHLIDDAPLVLMVYETMDTILVTAKDATRKDPLQRLADQHMSWKLRMGFGALLWAIATILLILAFYDVTSVFAVILPSLVLFLGFLTIVRGLRQRKRQEHANKDVIRGSLVAGAGIVLFVFWELYLVLILLALVIWFFSSAIVTLLRVFRERGNLPNGFWYTLGLGLSSLVLGILAVTLPEELVDLLVILLAGIVLMAGAFMILDAYGLRNAARLMEEGGFA